MWLNNFSKWYENVSEPGTSIIGIFISFGLVFFCILIGLILAPGVKFILRKTGITHIYNIVKQSRFGIFVKQHPFGFISLILCSTGLFIIGIIMGFCAVIDDKTKIVGITAVIYGIVRFVLLFKYGYNGFICPTLGI